MRVHRVFLRRFHRGIAVGSALLVLGAVAATAADAADAGTTVTGWGSIRQVALANWNGVMNMAWIDPHASNELTYSWTADGVHFATGIHPDWPGGSNSAPALASFDGRLWLAWTGTDANSTLNLSSTANGVAWTTAAQPLGHNSSSDGPAMTVFNGRLYYAWTGTDSNHTINIASSANGSTFTTPVQPGDNSSINAPALAVWNGLLYMAWAGTDPFHLINLAWSSDGVHFTQTHFQAIGSNFEPSLSPDPFNGALDIDYQNPSTSYINVISYVGKATVDPLQLTGPIVEAPTVSASASTMVHAWLGTDPGHTINVCYMNAGPPYC